MVGVDGDESVKERLLRDIAIWQADGLISPAAAATLRERSNLSRFGLAQVMRYLGVAGLIFVILGLLGLVAAIAGSPVFGGALLLIVGGGFVAAGIALARDRLGRYLWSSKVSLTLGVLAVSGAVAMLLAAAGIEGSKLVFAGGWIVLPVLLVLAYRFRITFLLVIALVEFFHWIGSWSTMWGRSTYVFEVQDPQVMAAAAIVVTGIGVWHEQDLAERTGRFFVAYESLGLVYLNLSLLILTIDSRTWAANWIAAFTAAAIGQIVLGARLRNRLMVGFGVTFLFIDGFTRFYEQF
ncbi:MAG TPA: hypothetical protein VGY57_15550, partial [Vicinamibacterales bacterium]|nr:hypothetical protein [Vicinamibacterales bacterium]